MDVTSKDVEASGERLLANSDSFRIFYGSEISEITSVKENAVTFCIQSQLFFRD